MKHKCPVQNCTAQVPAAKLMCPAHWSMVPKALGDALYREYRRAPHSVEHYKAMRDCINHVNELVEAA